MSIIRQTYTNWEILIYNDGSSDKETKWLQDTMKKTTNKFNIVGNDKVGVYRARIKLLEKIRSGYVLFLDSDDYYVDDKVFELIISKIKQTNSDIIYFNYLRCRNELNEEHCLFKKKYTKSKIDQQFLTNNNLNSLWNKAFNVKLLSTLKFNEKENFYFAEDRLIGAMLHERAKSISWINKSLYCYRDNQFSLSNSVIDKSRVYSQINAEEIISKLNFAKLCNAYHKESYILEHIVYPSLWYVINNCQSKKARLLLYKDIKSIKNRYKLNIKHKSVSRLYRRIAIIFLSWDWFRLLDLFMKLVAIIKGRREWV